MQPTLSPTVLAAPQGAQQSLSMAPAPVQPSLGVRSAPQGQQATLGASQPVAQPSLGATNIPQETAQFNPIPYAKIATDIPTARQATGNNDPYILQTIVAKYPQLGGDVGTATQAGASPTQILNLIQQRYTPVATQPNSSGPGLGQRMLQSIVQGLGSTLTDPIVSGVRALQATPALLSGDFAKARQIETTPANLGYLGKVTPYAGLSNTQLTGKALETGSLLVGGKAVSGITEGLNPILKTAAEGSLAGTIGGAGAGLQDPNATLGSVAQSAAIGAIGGGALGGAAGALGKGIGTATSMVNKGSEETLVNSLAKNYEKILNLGKKASDIEAATGKDTSNFLAREAIPLKVEGGKLDATDALATLEDKQANENQLFQHVLQSENKYLSLDKIAEDAKSNITAQGTDRTKAINHINNEMDAYKQQYGPSGVSGAKGDVLVPLDKINAIKQDIWSKTKNFGFPDANVTNATNKTFGNAFKSAIEDSVSDVNVKAFNQRLGDINQAISTLNNRNGQIVAGGGKMNRYVMRTIGAIAGGSHGGPFGALEGAYASDKVTQFLTDAQLPAMAKQKLLAYLQNSSGGAKSQILQDAENVLQSRARESLGRKALPGPSSIHLGPQTPPPDPSGIIPSTVRPGFGMVPQKRLPSPSFIPQPGIQYDSPERITRLGVPAALGQ